MKVMCNACAAIALTGLGLVAAGPVQGQGTASQAPPITVSIEIALGPGGSPREIRKSAAAIIPVAILSTATFDARQVDASSVILHALRLRLSGTPRGVPCRAQDVNHDGMLDLVCQIQTNAAGIQLGESPLVIEGRTQGGTRIRGETRIRIVADQ